MGYVWYGVSRSIEGLTSLQRQHACLVSSVSLEQGLTLGRYQKKKKKLSLFLDAAVGVWEFEVGNALAGWLEKTTASLLLLYYTYVRSLCKYIY